MAPVPDDLKLRTREIKGAAYYLDASHVGICELHKDAFRTQLIADHLAEHSHAIVIWVEYGRAVEADNPAHDWIAGAEQDIAAMRALEIGVAIAGHIRALGFAAECHTQITTPSESPTSKNSSDLYREESHDQANINLNYLGLRAGLGLAANQAKPQSLFFKDHYAAIAITTNYELCCDRPLAPNATLNPFKYWLGMNGATSGRELNRRARRASHLSRYPMEQVKRIERPTTLILDDEIPAYLNAQSFFNAPGRVI